MARIFERYKDVYQFLVELDITPGLTNPQIRHITRYAEIMIDRVDNVKEHEIFNAINDVHRLARFSEPLHDWDAQFLATYTIQARKGEIKSTYLS